jgi:excisionase family DNA binding protein
MKNNPEIWTVEEVSDYLRVSRKTVYNLHASGKLTGSRIGKNLRFLRQYIINIMEDPEKTDGSLVGEKL